MRAVVFDEPGAEMAVEEIPTPDCPPDGVVVETEACGVCRSDWHAWQGDWSWVGVESKPGLVFGHEPVGVVREVGPNVESIEVGDRVTNPFNLADGSCPMCQQGNQNVCEQSVPMGFVEFSKGAFAEEYAIHAADTNVVTLPDDVDPVAVAGLGCRFATAFHGITQRADLDAGDWVAVHGCGGVGLSAVHVADALGANVVAVDLKREALDKAVELGASHTVKVDEVDDVPRAVTGFTPRNRGADVSVDALGIAQTCRNSVRSLSTLGQHLQIGLTTSEEAGEVSIPVDEVVFDEREFLGSYGMPAHEYDDIFRMMDAGTIDPGAIVSETVSLEEVPETIASMGEYDTVGIPVCDEF
ncbi:alcohol dehydrogenase [Halobacteriales archaeon SW_6_65_46]|nr:MAG: alcohol dehydrogenase [Halobacteriales archaeon SW_6_65_46]